MKRFFIIFFVVVIVLAASFAGYRFWELNQDVSVADIVPPGAMAKLESSDFYNELEKTRKNNECNSFKQALFIKDLNNRLGALDSLLGKNQLKALSNNKAINAVFYPTEEGAYDFLLFVPVTGELDKTIWKNLLLKTPETTYTIDKRSLYGIEINELKKGGNQFSFVKFRNYMVSSSSPLLIENFIRYVSQMQDWFNIPKAHAEVVTKTVKTDLTVTLYYHELLNLASSCGDSIFGNFIGTFADSSELSLDLKDGQLFLNGFSSAEKKDFLYLFKNQKAKPLTIENYVPGNTAVFHYWSFEDGVNFQNSLEKYWKQNHKEQLDKCEHIKNNYLIDLKDYMTEFDNELAYIKLEEKGELLFIKVVDPERMFLQTSRLVTLFKKDKAADSLYSGSYKSVHIRQMNYEQFPSLLLGNYFQGFTTSYYGIIDNYLVFASDLKQFKNLIDDIDYENVWGKTLKMHAYLEENCSSSNYISIINVPKAKIYLDSAFTPTGCSYIDFIKQLDIASFQYTWINNKIYTRFGFKCKEAKASLVVDSANVGTEDIMALSNTIKYKPYCFKSKGIINTLVQDSLFNLYLISQNSQEWLCPLSSPIIDLALADLDRNGKNDIVFATQDSVYAITASKAENMPGFPIALPDKAKASQFSVIDYNKDKNYRILVADTKGDVYMFDGKGRVLEGWKPNKMAKKVVAPIKHIRIGDRDILLVQLEDGTIDAFNRKGEMYEGFPVGGKTECISPLFIDEGVNFEKTTITSLSIKGEFVVYNLKGELLKKEQFPTAPKDKFILKTDRQNRSFIIAQLGKEKNSIYNSKKELIYENYFDNKSLSVSYYNFGRNREYIILYNETDKETYLLNRKGETIASGIKSSSIPYLLYDTEDEELELINAENNIVNKKIVDRH